MDGTDHRDGVNHRRRYLLLIGLLILATVSLLLVIRFNLISVNGQGGQQPDDSSVPSAAATEKLDPDSERLVEAIRQAIERSKEAIPALLLFETQIDHIRFSNDKTWATAWITPLDPESKQPIPIEPGLVIARLVNEEWEVALPSDSLWVTLAQAAPLELLSAEEKAEWMQLAAPGEAKTPLAPITGYRLPWRAGESKALTQSVGHDQYTPSGSAHYAFDFASLGYPSAMFNVHAAKSGEVFRAVWSHPNGNESNSNYIVLKDTTTTPVTYQLYLHLAQDSIPVELRTIGTPVQQGQLIGVADDTGISSGNHLHFHVHTYAYSYWGESIDITFLDVAINGGRPRINSDLPYCLPSDVCDQTQTVYISGNTGVPDNQPPTGKINAPTQGSTQYSQLVNLAGSASDAGSGLASAQFLAQVNGSWQTIGPLFTASPFSYNWDVCAAQLSDGPLSLALELIDHAQNKTPLLYGLTHFTKSFNCPAAASACAPSSSQVALFAKPDYRGKCVLLNTGTYSSPTSLGTLGEDNAESILVGSSVKATLFSDASLQGRSETFAANDANLADNLVGANTVSSLLVQSRSATPNTPAAVWPQSGISFDPDASLSLAWRDGGGAAQFQARLSGSGGTITTSWQTEAYWHLSLLAPGAYTWQSRARYGAAAGAWNTGRAFQVSTQMNNPQASLVGVPYLETFESGAPGWTDNNTWAPLSGTNHTPGGQVSAQYKPGAGNNYDTGAPNAGYLTSPPISLPLSGEYFLRFWYLYATESANPHWDQRWMQISANGGPFVNVLQLSDDAMNYWLSSPAIPLAAYAGQSIQVRFYFVTLDSALNNYQGWLIDDFAVAADPPPSCTDSDNTPAQAALIGYNSFISGVICPGGDVDYFTFQGVQGDHIGIRAEAQALGSPLDPYLFFLDSDGRSVLAENDDIVPYERSDSLISYTLNRSGTYYIKLRSWDHPTSGGLNYTYNLHLVRDSDNPIAFFIYPQEGQSLPAGPIDLTVAAIDPTTDISFVKFFWHPADWYNGQWIEIGNDWNGQDDWNISFDTRSVPLPSGIAFYAMVYDWAGNWLGTGIWNLKMPSIFTPFLLRLP